MTTMTRTRTVGELMTREVLTVPETMNAHELALFLSEHEISGAPVVTATGTLVGVVSTSDLARLTSENVEWRGEERQSFYRATPFDEEVMAELYGLEALATAPTEGSDTQVRDFMSPVIQSVEEDATVAEVARLMLAGHYHRLLVTRDGALAGIVTALDLLALLAEEET
jgi:CBS domain-containing protein